MTLSEIERIVRTVKESAKEYPLIFIELLTRRALRESGAEAIPQLAKACEDMGHWYQAQADALEAEGCSRGQNVVELPRAGK